MSYIVVKHIRRLAKESGRRISKDFVATIDSGMEEIVKKWVSRACCVHNGGRKTLDATVAAFSKPKVS